MRRYILYQTVKKSAFIARYSAYTIDIIKQFVCGAIYSQKRNYKKFRKKFKIDTSKKNGTLFTGFFFPEKIFKIDTKKKRNLFTPELYLADWGIYFWKTINTLSIK